MTEPHRPLAVVTGASSGIGLELAREFSRHGFELVVAAEDDGLRAVADALGAEGVQVDLATPAGVEELHARVRHRHVTALALNAGITARSDDLDRELELVDLNCRSLVHLARLLTAEMAAAGRGRVLITASIVEAFPGPHQAAYNASKAFARSFGISLRHELRDHGVSVTVLEPGATDTPIFAKAGQETTILGGDMPKDEPSEVAQQAFEALMAGRETVVAASTLTKATHLVSRFLPDAVTARVSGLLTKPR
ncbi:SDR family NAD(P)-dependent oxidoreductase [Solirubrobacter sp. CPCC 204708]|uniref:SDR family NAD(P)-dependent oxidoreductase n=1 Tax=Solirubrobacter deserti TaxID=2282478 RepID=A0ABT4RDD5_9ACTN|nr:SDR family NAD(P)-dependent oxidoreductase [Solirubrobacter deserti]MBE2314527.1 SDR family NAD(P)-dependent oxidoreductase [Solirubrobacter deserti]MDA0136531.1 SDR family NAD(P)-dependent oxidoreductase [Solirubrobacter deserti]